MGLREMHEVSALKKIAKDSNGQNGGREIHKPQFCFSTKSVIVFSSLFQRSGDSRRKRTKKLENYIPHLFLVRRKTTESILSL